MNTRKAMAVQLAKREMVPWVQEGKTSLTTSTTGPQVFHTQHWNMASRENTAATDHITTGGKQTPATPKHSH